MTSDAVRVCAAVAHAALFALTVQAAAWAARHPAPDGRAYALAAGFAELLKLCACGAALREPPAALARRVLAAAAAPPGALLTIAAACHAAAAALAYANLAYTPAAVYSVTLLGLRLFFAETLRCGGACDTPGRASGAAAAALGAAIALTAVHPFPARNAFVITQALLSAAAEAAERRAARLRGGCDAQRQGCAGAAERDAPVFALSACASLGVLAVAGAWAAGGGNAAAAARHAQSACHGHVATVAALRRRGGGAFAVAVLASAANGLAASARAAPPQPPPDTAPGVLAAEAAAYASLAALLAGGFAAGCFRETFPPRFAVAAALLAFAYARHAHGTHASRTQRLAAAAAVPKPPASAASPDGEWLRSRGCGAVGALFAAILAVIAGIRGMWGFPGDARLSSFSEAPDTALQDCVLPPTLWAPRHSFQPAPYKRRHPDACAATDAGPRFYNLSSAPHYGTFLTMACAPGYEARYGPNFLDADVAAWAVAGVSRTVPFEPDARPEDGAPRGSMLLSHRVTHVELVCAPSPATSASAGAARSSLRVRSAQEGERREVALLPGPLARRLAMAGVGAHADPDGPVGTDTSSSTPAATSAAAPRQQQPNVLVLLMDALSRPTAESVLPNWLSALRAEGAYAPSVAAALEYRHFGIVGMNSKPNWAAMFCGGNCSGPGSVNAALPLLDAARAAGFATMHLNNFYPGYPYPWLPGGAGPEVRVPEQYAALHPGDRTDCRMGDSVSRSWLAAGIGALAAPRHPDAPPIFAVIAPHEAHSKKAYDYDRLSRLEPDLIGAMAALNSSGVLDNSLLVIISDHGIHFGRFKGQLKERHAPACSAHRSPFLWAFVGRSAAPRLLLTPEQRAGGAAATAAALEAALARARTNADRLVTMHDAYATLADALGVRGAGGLPAGGELKVTPHAAALNFLTDEVQAGRTCREAAIPPGYCNCFRHARGRDTPPWMDFKC